MFLGFTVAGCLGAAVIFTLKDAPPLRRPNNFSANAGEEEDDDSTKSLIATDGGEKGSYEEEEGGGKKGGGAGLWDTLQLAATSRRMQLLIPAVLFNGASLGFSLGAFTTVFAQGKKDEQGNVSYVGLLPANLVGFYGATFYLTNSFFSYIWGKFLPIMGRRRLFYVSFIAMTLWVVIVTVVCAGGLAPTFSEGYVGWTPAWSSPAAYLAVFVSAAVFAVGDSVLESQVPAIVQSPTYFPLERERDAANSNIKMWQSLGFSIQFGLGSGLSGLGILPSAAIQTYVLLGLYILCYACIFYCDRFVAPFDTSKAK